LERESDDAELHSLLGRPSTNLGLYGRWRDVEERDREYAVAEQEHRAVLYELRLAHLVQLEAALEVLYAIHRRNADRPRVHEAALADAEAVVRLVDDAHAERVRSAHAAFVAGWGPHERPLVAEHRAQVQETLEGSAALVVAGGHVGELLRVLRLFDVGASLPATVVAWSAGAMALTERVVLFHDRGPQGTSPAEIYGDGLGVLRGMVLLPHARRRLRVDDPIGMAVLARRFAPARCVVLDDGVCLELSPDLTLPGTARIVTPDGRIGALEDQ